MRIRPSLTFPTVIAATGAIIAVAMFAIFGALWQFRADTIDAANDNSQSLAIVLTAQVSRALEPVDAALLDLIGPARRALETRGTPSGTETDSLRWQLQTTLATIPHALAIVVADADGNVVASTGVASLGSINIADRPFFRERIAASDDDLHVIGPVIGRFSHQQIILLSRRVAAEDGGFAGLIGISIPFDYLQNVYRSVETLADRSFMLIRRDGTILARFPDDILKSGDRLPQTSRWYEVSKQGSGVFLGAWPNGVPRWIAVQAATHLPLVVNVSLTESAILAVWRQRAIWTGIGTLLAVIVCAGLLNILVRQWRSLDAARHHIDAALNSMSHGVCLYDRRNRLIVHNARYCEMYRLEPEDLRPGTAVKAILRRRAEVGTGFREADNYLAEVKTGIARGDSVLSTTHLHDGRTITIRSNPTQDGGWVSVHEDVTERTLAEERIAHMARYDALTDLANRSTFTENLNDTVTRLEETGESFAVLIFDVDLFKSVNDTLGHAGGDALLAVVAARLRGIARPCDTIGRIGGDEFAVIIPSAGDPRGAAESLATAALERICAPCQIDGVYVVVGISIGISIAPRDGREPNRLLKQADLALYRAKADGRGCYRFFEPDMDAEIRLRREFEFRLREALFRGEFEVHYQPIIDLATGRPCSVEALVRWRHPEQGLVPPDRFIPAAEENGLIIPLGKWILNTACSTATGWPESVRLSVNLSAVQFLQGDLGAVVREALDSSGLAPCRLELEITESVLLQKDRTALDLLHDLAGLGVHIVLDDFGTGYSSLSYLQLFPFSKIKIDKSFIADMPSRSDCAAIVCTALNLARTLGMDTTAEGVETWEQVALLRAGGCRELQGWLFGRPCPAADLVLDRPLVPENWAQKLSA